ncbi:hypothetical protein GPECTOR_1335g570 [Gonium pectorale]|uniref:Uncharacterized protein n=1 Tax=Gonium pectorale TaxID=33097 RepID=A0A150FUR2_GONPE|nr:hypothetical protein GPECTOR_1335g570 [Gonium pectorale]|eukprot:KXZ40915.1 hypothetical protein GPECTOR_1335g570 [Gonium pectorale]
MSASVRAALLAAAPDGAVHRTPSAAALLQAVHRSRASEQALAELDPVGQREERQRGERARQAEEEERAQRAEETEEEAEERAEFEGEGEGAGEGEDGAEGVRLEVGGVDGDGGGGGLPEWAARRPEVSLVLRFETLTVLQAAQSLHPELAPALMQSCVAMMAAPGGLYLDVKSSYSSARKLRCFAAVLAGVGVHVKARPGAGGSPGGL